MKITIPKIEFYITNVCNLSCDGCNRFNNLKFKGWQDWAEYSDIYAQWAELVDIEQIVILGGEPTLNPTLTYWIYGLRKLWPQASIQVLTNGTRLPQQRDLYQACLDTNTWIGISMHHKDLKDELFAAVRGFLQDTNIYQESATSLPGKGGNYYFEDANGVNVIIWKQFTFLQNSLLPQGDSWTLYNSDPTKAHRNCVFVKYKSYHMIHGQLHKCGPAPLYIEFDQQFNLALTSEDRTLVHAYRGYTPEDARRLGHDLFANIDQVIPQCKFCPEEFQSHRISLENLRSKIK